jgi:V/A-type H+-transporting ATPase subunit G/H
MKPQVLYEIKDAEAEAQKLIDDAQIQKQNMIEDAKRQAMVIIEEAKKEAKKIEDEMNASAELELANIRKGILNSGEKQIFEIKQRAQKKKTEALEYILEEFKREAHV